MILLRILSVIRSKGDAILVLVVHHFHLIAIVVILVMVWRKYLTLRDAIRTARGKIQAFLYLELILKQHFIILPDLILRACKSLACLTVL